MAPPCDLAIGGQIFILDKKNAPFSLTAHKANVGVREFPANPQRRSLVIYSQKTMMA